MIDNNNKPETVPVPRRVADKSIAEPAFKYYLDMLRRRIWIVATIFTVVFTLGTIKTIRSPEIYQSVAKLIVVKEVPRLINIDGVRSDMQGWDPEFYQTKADLIKSRDVIEMAMQDPAVSNMFTATEHVDQEALSFFDEVRRTFLSLLGGQPPPPPSTWQRLASHISSSHVEDTHFVLLKAEDVIPRNTLIMAQAVSKAYEKYHYQQQRKMHGDTFEFLEREKDKAEGLLAKAEGDLQTFRQNTAEISPAGKDADQPVIKRLNELNDKLTETQLSRVDLSSQLTVIKQLFASKESNDKKAESLYTVPVVKADAQATKLRDDIQETEAELTKLRNVYGAAHPLLKSTEQKIVALKRDFKEAVNTRVQSVINELKALRAKEIDLEKQYQDQKKSALGFAQESFQYARLQADVSRHRKLLDTLIEKMSQVDLSAGYLKVNVDIVEEPSLPTFPIRPDKKRGMMMFAMLGLILGVGVAFVVEDLDDVIKTPEDLKHRLGLPVIGFIPKMEEEAPLLNRKKAPKKKLKPGEAPPQQGTGIDGCEIDGSDGGKGSKLIPGRMSLTDPMSSIAEAYRHIRTNLFYSIPADQKKVLGFVSASPAEGKTTTASNIALTIALSGRKVLLLDADFHRPMVNRVHGLKNRVGLSSVLVGEATVEESISHIMHEGKAVENLDVILAGPQSPNPAELLGSKKMEELLAKFRKEYDWVIVDTPPILYVSDACIVSTLCDGIVVVVRAGKNNRSMLNRALEQLDAVNVDIIGGILNMVKISKLGRNYSSYYYYGYASYRKDYHRSYYNEDRDIEDSVLEEEK